MMRNGRSRPAVSATLVQRLSQWLPPPLPRVRADQLPHTLTLPPLLLYLILLLAACESIVASPLSPQLQPAQRLISALRGGVCPCAYLERGGFWSGNIAADLGVVNGVYVEKRCRCTYEFNCVRSWQQSNKSVTVTWVGSPGVSASQIQLQFCSAIYDATLAPCLPDEVTFSLRQLGWWLDLQGMFCRCPGSGPPAIRSFIYAKPVGLNDAFNGRLVDFVCESKRMCQTDEWCYEELLDSEQRLTHGSVTCSCPAGTFCPIYTIGAGVRLPMYSPTKPSAVIGYRLRCRPESPA